MSVEAVQDRLTWDVETAVAVSPVGTVGAWVSGAPGVMLKLQTVWIPPFAEWRVQEFKPEVAACSVRTA